MTDTDIVNPNERIVRVVEHLKNGAKRVFYAIRDVVLDYWRGRDELGGYYAWTRSCERRVEFSTRREAKKEMERIWQWRREQNVRKQAAATRAPTARRAGSAESLRGPARHTSGQAA